MNCGCYSVNASDISPVLVALDAEIVTTKKVRQKPSSALAERAAEAALEGCQPMKDNGYKKQEVKALIKRMVAAMV